MKCPMCESKHVMTTTSTDSESVTFDGVVLTSTGIIITQSQCLDCGHEWRDDEY